MWNLATYFTLLTHFLGCLTQQDGLYIIPDTETRYRLEWNDMESLRLSRFIPNYPTRIVIHGFAVDGGQEMNLTVGFLKAGVPGNYLFVIWSSSAGATQDTPAVEATLNLSVVGAVQFPFAYLGAVERLPIVAKRMAYYLAWLHKINYIRGEDITLIGHSLGAHLAGEMARVYRIQTGGDTIGRIIGLDPAGPLYTFPPTKTRPLTGSDASFVQTYHTNAGVFGVKPGTLEGIHLEIVVNGGSTQPGCKGLTVSIQNNLLSVLCAHIYSQYMFRDSVYHPHEDIPWRACKCDIPDKGFGVLPGCMIECEDGFSGFEPPPTTARGRYYVRYKKEYGILPGIRYIKESMDGDHQIVNTLGSPNSTGHY